MLKNIKNNYKIKKNIRKKKEEKQMTPIINLSDPYAILVTVVLFVLVLWLARETKKSSIVGTMLVVFLVIIVGHSIEYITTQDPTGEIIGIISRSIGMDFVFIFLSFITYLWIDDIESKEKKKKSLDNSLDWFWKKV